MHTRLIFCAIALLGALPVQAPKERLLVEAER